MPQLVRIISLRIILEPIYYGIVVHIHTEQKIGRIDLVAQERLCIIGLAIEVTVEIGDIVIVLVDTWKYRIISQQSPTLTGVYARAEIAPAPIGQFILIVVIIDEFKDVALLAIVMDFTFSIGYESTSRIIRINAESLGKHRPWVAALLRSQIHCTGFVVGECLAPSEVFVGIAPRLSIAHILATQLKSSDVADRQIETQHPVSRRQAVAKAMKRLVRAVLYITRRPQQR